MTPLSTNITHIEEISSYDSNGSIIYIIGVLIWYAIGFGLILIDDINPQPGRIESHKHVSVYQAVSDLHEHDARNEILIELKDKDFKPEYAGKMNFYLSVVDDLVKHETDQPSIGLILCKTKNNVLAEYTFQGMSKPIGLAEYRIAECLPDDLKTVLPTIEELEAELSKGLSKLEPVGIHS